MNRAALQSSFFLLLTAVVLTGCLGISFDEDEESNTASSSNSRSMGQSVNGYISPQNIEGNSVSLEPYFSFYLKNESGASLNGYSVRLLAGTAQTQFAHISASLASSSPVEINIPSFIVDNTVYILIEGDGTRVFERHQIQNNKITAVKR